MLKSSRPFGTAVSILSLIALSMLIAVAIGPLRDPLGGPHNAAPNAFPVIPWSRTQSSYVHPPAQAIPSVANVYATLTNLPLAFEPNRGQSLRNAVYLARGANFNLYLNSSEAVLSLPQVTRLPQSNVTGTGSESSAHVRSTHLRITRSLLHLRFTGANPSAPISALDPLVEKVNYLDRTDSAGQQITQVPTFAKVEYQDIYPGIDLAYHGTRRQLEYDFVVGPGADPTLIRMNITGGKSLRLDRAGNLLIETSAGLLTEHKPLVYQQRGDTRQEIAGSFQLVTQNGLKQVAFALASYDHTLPLVIDPTLVYQDNVAGPGLNAGGFTAGKAVAVDSAGNAYLTGEVDSDFESGDVPSACDLLNTDVNVCTSIFVTKVNAAGTAVIYNTTVGGGVGLGIAVDSAGNAYVAGGGSVFGTPNAFQQNEGGAQCPNGNSQTVDCTTAVVAVLNSAGAFTYASNLGGTLNNDQAEAIAIDAGGKIYVTGQAFSANFPSTAGAFQTTFNSNNSLSAAVFVAKIDPTLSGTASLVYSTFLGGAGQGEQAGLGGPAADEGRAIAVDSAGEAYIAGETFSSTLATSGSFQSKQPEPISPFVAKFNASGSSLLWATYLGGTQGAPCFYEAANAIALDSSGNPYVAGLADSDDFPTTPGAFETKLPSESSGFATKLNGNGTALIYSTFVGGFTSLNKSRSDLGCQDQNAAGIAVDTNDDAFISGQTLTGDFPVAPLSLKPMSSGLDGYVAELNPAGSALLFSSYMPGKLTGIAIDNLGGIYVSGEGNQIMYNVANLGSADAPGGAFVDKVDLTGVGPAVFITPSAVWLANGNGATGTFTLENLGNGPLTISSITPNGDFTEMDNCSGMVAAGSSCTLTVASTGGEGSLSIADNAFDSPQTVIAFEGGNAPAAAISKSVLAFDATNVGSTSPAQIETLASVGNAPLAISSISTTAGFAEVNNCGSTLAVETSCQISVTFTPTKSSSATGTLEIDDNGTGPSEVSLTAGAPGLGIGIDTNDSMATITPGQTAKYTVQIYDLSGYIGPATVTCSGAPKGATCKASSPITLEGATSVNENITVTTTGGSSFAIRDFRPETLTPAFANLKRWFAAPVDNRQMRYLLASVLIALSVSLLFILASPTKRRQSLILSVAAFILCTALVACGSNTTIIVQQPPPTSNATPPGTYTLIVTVTAAGTSKDTALTLQVN